MRSLVSAAVLSALLISLAGCGDNEDSEGGESAPEAPKPIEVTGSVSAPNDGIGMFQRSMDGDKVAMDRGAGCDANPDGYDDIHEGAQVVVRGADGTTLGLGKLFSGTLFYEQNEAPLDAVCVFNFAVHDIAAGQKFYSVEVADRGAVEYEEDDLASPIELTVE